MKRSVLSRYLFLIVFLVSWGSPVYNVFPNGNLRNPSIFSEEEHADRISLWMLAENIADSLGKGKSHGEIIREVGLPEDIDVYLDKKESIWLLDMVEELYLEIRRNGTIGAKTWHDFLKTAYEESENSVSMSGEVLQFNGRGGVLLIGDHESGKSTLAIKMMDSDERWRCVSCGASDAKWVDIKEKRFLVGKRRTNSSVIFSRVLGKREVALSEEGLVSIMSIISLDDTAEEFLEKASAYGIDIIKIEPSDVTADFSKVSRQINYGISHRQSEKDLFQLGLRIGKVIFEKRKDKLNRPINIILVGDHGTLKEVFSETLRDSLRDIEGLSVETDKTDSWENMAEGQNLSYFDEKYKDKDVIILEVFRRYPRDYNNIDFLVRLKSSLGLRQERINMSTGSYEAAQIMTMEDSSPDFEDRQPDYVFNTEYITVEFIESGRLMDFLRRGLEEGFGRLDKVGGRGAVRDQV